MTAKHLTGLAAIPIGEIRPSSANPRSRLTDLDELALSIRENGLVQPIIVQQVPGFDGYQIVAGHRRYAAVVKLGWSSAPCIIRRDMLPDEELLAMLVENGQRANLDPIEEARALHRLKRTGGLTDNEIGRKIGRSDYYVRTRLALLQLPEEEQEALRAGHSTLERAVGLVRSERQEQRRRENPVARPVGRPKGAKTKPYFGDDHPLARTVRAICDHRGTPKVGGVGCGPCWESAIRDDAGQAYATGYAEQQRVGAP